MTLEDFYKKYKGTSPLYIKGNESLRGQCVQLIALYVSEAWHKPVIHADAYYWFLEKNLPEHYIRIPKNPQDPHQVPPRGAIVVFGPNTPGSQGAGHVSICWDAKINQATWVGFDSNWGGKYAHLVTHNWQNVVGWIVPRNLPVQTKPQVPAGGDEMIASRDDAIKIYQMLRPNGKPSEGEIAGTAGKRTYHNFVNDAQAEIKKRNANLAKQAEQFNKMKATINELNKTITELRASRTQDASLRAEEQHAAQEKISYLTTQLESLQDNIADLNSIDIPAEVQADADKPGWLTRLILAVINIRKK